MDAPIKPKFHCFVLDDEKDQRTAIAEILSRKDAHPRKYASPQQMSEDIDRLHRASSSADPVFAVIDGEMNGANYDDTSCDRPVDNKYESNIAGALRSLDDKQKEGKIGDYIVALHSGHVGECTTYGIETPIDRISSNKFKPNPGDFLEVIKIKKASSNSRNLIIRAFEFAKEVFSSTPAHL